MIAPDTQRCVDRVIRRVVEVLALPVSPQASYVVATLARLKLSIWLGSPSRAVLLQAEPSRPLEARLRHVNVPPRTVAAHRKHEGCMGSADPNRPHWYADCMVAEQAGERLPSRAITLCL